MKIKHTLFGLTVSSFLLLSSASPAFAQSPSAVPWQQRVENRQETRQEVQDQIQANVEGRVELRCDLVNNKIDIRITRYNQNYDEVEARITRVTERMNEFADRLETKGYDVTEVRNDLQTIKEMKTTRRSYYTAFIQKLEATKQYDCGESEGAFRSSLTESRAALTTYRSQVKSVWDFINNTLKPDLQALKGQNPNPATSE